MFSGGNLKDYRAVQSAPNELKASGVTEDGKTCQVIKRKDENGAVSLDESGDPSCLDLVKKRVGESYRD